MNAPATSSPHAQWRGLALLGKLLLVLAVLLALMIGGAWWMLRTSQGTANLLRLLPNVQVLAPQGPLWGDFAAQRVEIELSPTIDGRRGDHIVLTNIAWRRLTLALLPGGPPWLHAHLDELRADAIDAVTSAAADADPTPPPPALPRNLRLPVALDIGSLHVGTVRATALGETPLRDLQARIDLAADGTATHRLDDVSVAWGKLRAAGSVHVGVFAPMAIDAHIDVRQLDDPVSVAPAAPPTAAATASPLADWTAGVDVHGPLERPAVQATLRASGQSLDARATLLPFAAWPLADLDASVKSLDLSAMHAAAPATSFSGTAHATTSGRGEPVGVQLDLRNGVAGRWSDGKLPLTALSLTAQGRPSDPSTIELHAFDIVLGTSADSGGRIAGSAEWHAGNWSVDAALEELQPAVLDARLASMRLSGPLVMSGTGFAAPTGPAAASSSPGAGAPGTATTAGRPTLSLRAELTGRVQLPGSSSRSTAAVRAVELRVDASANDRHVEIRRVEARSGAARATLSGTASRSDAVAPWQVAARLGLGQFDPAPWWPGPASSPWRDGPHRINAEAVANVSIPASLTGGAAGSAPPAPMLSRLAGLRGQVTMNIAPSQLAGVPLEGNLKIVNVAPGNDLQATATLNAAGNTMKVNGRLALSGSGTADRWQLDVNAPALAPLAPLLRLAQAGAAPASLAGNVVATAHVDGRWPAVSTTGQVSTTALQVGTTTVAQASARWQLGTATDAALALQLDVGDAVVGPQHIDAASVQLRGTAASHTLQARVQARALPPAWIDDVRPATRSGSAMPTPASAAVSSAIAAPAPASAAIVARPGAASAVAAAPAASASLARAAAGAAVPSTRGTLAVLSADGGLIGDIANPAAVAGWRGKLRQLDVSDTAPGATPWVHVDPVDIEVNANGPAPRASLSAGHADVLGAGVRWSQVAWQGGTQPRLDVQAELEPLVIAPILARLQPDFGWSGDLALAGRIDVRSAPQLVAHVELARHHGDLRVSDNLGLPGGVAAPRGSQPLGLTALRIAADVQDGTWRFTQTLTSSNFGVLAGAQTVKTSPQALWPGADAPIDGTLTARVADLGSLSPWVPANWRLSGQLDTSARIGGRFGAPEYTGQVAGHELGVRNLLEGVSLSGGDVLIALQGSTARIDHFRVDAGKGNATLEGGATFGAAPQASIKLVADRFQVLGRVDRRIVVSGDASLKLDAKTVAVDGSFKLDEGLIDFSRSDAPTLSDDVTVVRTKNQPKDADTSPSDPPVNRNVAINVRFDLGDKLRIKGRGIDTGLGGDLRLTSPDGRLSANGTIGTIGGTYQAYGQKLAIDRGVLVFNGPVDNPRLDIEATRPDIDTRVGVQVTGQALSPRVRLFADATMSDTDKLSWLVLGRAPDSLGRSDTALLQRAAMGLLSGEGSGATDSMIKSLGLDDVSLSQQTEGDVKQTVVALGKQLSKRWYVGYERSLNGTAGGWQLIYRIAQRFTLRAQAGLDSSMDLIWTWRY